MTIKPTLLLHSCCAPCSSSVLERLTTDFDVTVLYYNPNIYPESEYLKRLEDQKKFLKQIGINLIEAPYNPDEYEKAIKNFENLGEKTMRCYQCYKLRLEKTAEIAKKHNFDFFTTTLSVSPHKNSDWINEIGEKLSNSNKPKFLVSNFKKQNGYLRSLQLSKNYGFYRQNYCGCKMSFEVTSNKLDKKHNMWYILFVKPIILQYAKKSNTKIFFESLLTGFLISLCLLVCCVLVFFTTHTFLRISGESMEPGIASSGQCCIVKNNSSFTYGDIIVIHKDTTKDVIKRVIAMQGDKVGFFYLKNKKQYQVVRIEFGSTKPVFLEEPYLSSFDVNKKSYEIFITSLKDDLHNETVNGQTVQMLTIPENYVFYLGDNRANSEDCSHYGPKPISSVQGKVVEVFWESTPAIFVAIKVIFGFWFKRNFLIWK